MKSRLPFFLLLLGLAAGLSAALFCWPQLYAALIDPIARVVWLGARMVLMIDQEVYWILLIFAGFILAALAVPPRPQDIQPARHSQPPSPEDRVTSWQALLTAAQTDPRNRLALERRLNELQETVRSLAGGDEPAVALPPLDPAPSNGRRAGWHKILRLLRRRGPSTTDPATLHRVEQLITALENALEIPNDRSNLPHDRA